ncbi:hypothetical protein BAY61_18375 [Prauserella marina]|uniref:Uncharacterized protein n=1 Tax=Prauserella marina TaxID=530584 RepID=A0A222VS20_9PSEU|nr:DUF5994 family protein [Prauserella marina]ASR36642.1 hypothetical protein BAY61_18375 [Prauserella marina]PWV74058.1 hypothetical protein DES30_108232 [Prauserella marina]SDD61935.1 hypothetical protein SAMN05421630_110233 [Prauserella marina]
MTSNSYILMTSSTLPMSNEPAGRPLRLRMKRVGAPTGRVDGVWWPRSRDLAVELPDLLAALQIWHGRIERVTYNLTMWKSDTRRLTVPGGVVRLEGFRSQATDTVTIAGSDRRRLTLLVVPPEATPLAGGHAMTTTTRHDNRDGVRTWPSISSRH